LPFKLLGFTIEIVFEILRAIILLPFKILRLI
jgi:hypothetical protein